MTPQVTRERIDGPATTLLHYRHVGLKDRAMTKPTALLVSVSAALALSFAIPSVAHAQVGGERRLGLGLALGYPDIGLSGQYFMNARTSVQLVASFWYRNGRFGHDYIDRGTGVFLRADYLFHPVTLIRGTTADLGFYVGPGLYAGFGSGENLAFGGELPVGLEVQFKSVPVDLAFEAVPRLAIASYSGIDLGFSIGGAFHIRYYF